MRIKRFRKLSAGPGRIALEVRTLQDPADDVAIPALTKSRAGYEVVLQSMKTFSDRELNQILARIFQQDPFIYDEEKTIDDDMLMDLKLAEI